ncbi:MAG: nicotinamide mononucleotide transporter [Deferribacterales bacterium]
MMNLDVIMWALTILSVVGVVLNIHKSQWCFAVWCGTNAGWAIIDYRAGLYQQAALFVLYFALSLWGLIKWRRA